jgi:hypothetical protein
MKTNYCARISVVLAAFLPLALSAQLLTTPLTTPEEAIEDFLLGSGVLIENVVFNGSAIQISSFSGGTDQLGMESGLMMASAAASIPIDLLDVTWGEGLNEDADLLSLANSVPALIGQGFYVSSVYDVASLEFDFIPYGENISFRYVFGSEEYITWVNSSFNDVFGFFISGPGIEGPFSAPEGFDGGSMNIAVVPESDPGLPITVSSVNHILNTQYYIDNYDNGQIGEPLNGQTTVFTAEALGLQIGETYHIRLAIADGSDMALASAIFLEAGSFNSEVVVDPNDVGDLNGDGVLNIYDLLLIIANFGCEGEACIGDFDSNLNTDVQDILFFLSLF